MGLMNKKIAPKKPAKKMAPKPIKKQIVEQTVEPIEQQIEQPMVEQSTEPIQEDKQIDNTETKTDVNAEEKIDFIDGENLKTEEKSETEVTPVNDLKTVSEVEVEVEIETKTKKSKKKTSQKKNKTDNDSSERITDIKEAEEYLSDVINFTSKEWEEEKEELSNMMKTLTILATLNPDELKKLLSDMSNAYTTIKERLVDVERTHKSLQKQIKDIRTLNSIGSNTLERNLNAQKAVMFFKKNKDDEKSVDLEQYDLVQQDKIDFYRSCIDTMSYNRQLLITFASAFKIEINNY